MGIAQCIKLLAKPRTGKSLGKVSGHFNGPFRGVTLNEQLLSDWLGTQPAGTEVWNVLLLEPRVAGCHVHLDSLSHAELKVSLAADVPPLFADIVESSRIEWHEAAKIFNLGYRFEIYCDPRIARRLIGIAQSFGVQALRPQPQIVVGPLAGILTATGMRGQQRQDPVHR